MVQRYVNIFDINQNRIIFFVIVSNLKVDWQISKLGQCQFRFSREFRRQGPVSACCRTTVFVGADFDITCLLSAIYPVCGMRLAALPAASLRGGFAKAI